MSYVLCEKQLSLEHVHPTFVVIWPRYILCDCRSLVCMYCTLCPCCNDWQQPSCISQRISTIYDSISRSRREMVVVAVFLPELQNVRPLCSLHYRPLHFLSPAPLPVTNGMRLCVCLTLSLSVSFRRLGDASDGRCRDWSALDQSTDEVWKGQVSLSFVYLTGCQVETN